MLIALRSAFLGAGVISAFLQVAGSPVPPAIIRPLVCPSLGNSTSSYALCSNDASTDLWVETNDNTIDIEFVYFTAPQTGNAVYSGGTLLGTVNSATYSGSEPFIATLNDVVFPTATTSDTFYVYARLSVADPDLTDTTCHPHAEIVVIINPLPLANAGANVAICPNGSTILSASGGVDCQWLPATGLSNTDTCAPVAAPSFTTTYTATVTNQFGCFASDEVTVSIHEPLGVTCNDNVLISIGPSGLLHITPDMILEGLDEGLDVYSVTIFTLAGVPVPNPLTCAYVGQTLKVKITDTCNGSSCWGTAKIEDKLPPTLVCKDLSLPCFIENFAPNDLATTLGIAAGKPSVSENCTLNSLVFNDIWQTVACGDSIDGKPDLSTRLLRKWTATDVWGNASTCEQRIYLKRRHANEVIFPTDTIVSCENPSTDPIFTGAPYFKDFNLNFPIFSNNNLCEISTTYSDELIPVCDGTLKIKRRWTVIDWCFPDSLFSAGSNPRTYDQLIKILDNQGPAFICPADLTVTTDPFNCCATVDLPDVMLEDNCSRLNDIGAMAAAFDYYTGDPVGMFQVNGNLTDFPNNNYWLSDTLGVLGATPCLPFGAHVVTYLAEDDCGNSTTCSFRLTVADLTPPLSACNEYTQVALGIDGMALIDAAVFDAGSKDNCNEVHFKVRRMDANDCQPNDFFDDEVKFCCEDASDTVTVIFRVYDSPPPPGEIPLDFDLHNFNECKVKVFVEDKLKPSCVPPPNVTVSCESFDISLGEYGFATSTDNCCLDTIKESVNYNLFDTICNKGTIIRTFRPFDCNGQNNQCVQRIVVEYKQDYFIKFPDDKIVTICDGSANFGGPIFFGQNCEMLGISYEDVIHPVVTDACYKIERTWNIINWCTYDPNKPCVYVPNPDVALERPFILPGPVVSAPGTVGAWASTIIKVLPTDAAPTDYSVFWDMNANCFTYKQIIIVEDTKDPKIANCPATPPQFCDLTNNAPQLWNENYWFDLATNSHDLCEGQVDLTLTATDLCTGTNLNYNFLLYLDLDRDGILETVVNGKNPPAPGMVNFGNATNPGFTGGTALVFDHRPVSTNQKWNFAVETSVSGINKTAFLRWNTINNPAQFVQPELPHGTHRIEWIVEDGCGNESYCSYYFTVKDCKPPTIVCLNGLSVNIMPTQMIQLWATDFLQYAQDNCTPPTATQPSPNLLKYAIVKSAESTGQFPTDADGNPLTNVIFTCSELGNQAIQLWAQDLAGNSDYCETVLNVQDNLDNCTPGGALHVAGILKTETEEGVEDALIQLQIALPNGSAPVNVVVQTNDQGGYFFQNYLLSGWNYTVMPTKNDNPLNGVSTYDLVLISKHILGLQPLGNPYKMIAADANKSNSITTFDIVELRKLILGIYPELPNNTSWRFVDKNFVFQQPTNPFAMPFPEIYTGTVDSLFGSNDFVAIKIGDVNNTVIPSSFASTDDRSDGTFLFDVENLSVQAGVEFLVKFKATERALGYQFTLNFKDLELLEVLPNEDLTLENFGIFQDAITVSQDGEGGEFVLKFRARRSGQISQILAISSHITRAEAYKINDLNEEMTLLDVALRFNGLAGSAIVGVGFELYQNQPNPFENKTVIGFHLPEAGEVTLTIFDEMGRVLLSQKASYSKGYNAIALNGTRLDAAGVLVYKLETAKESAVRKMVRMK